jgi:pyruvate kinase
MSNSKFKIISTIGPASLNSKFLKRCNDSEQSYFRINTAFLSPAEAKVYLKLIFRHTNLNKTEIYLDLPGAKPRIGELEKKLKIELTSEVSLIHSEKNSGNCIPIPYLECFEIAEVGDYLLLQDGTIKIKIIHTDSKQMKAKVIRGGVLRSGAGYSLMNKSIPINFEYNSVLHWVDFAKTYSIPNIALSYIAGKEDIRKFSEICKQQNFKPKVIAKIERREALSSLQDICLSADEIWYCRGDLGISINLKELGYWQEVSIESCKKFEIPIIIAGQVFYHLTDHSSPTRSEVVHFYQIQKQGVDGIVLSDETVRGYDPVSAVEQVFSLL